ncbi:MAG: hypothetical protein K2M10_07265, partial [Muribaculaceae bacterium]|nr:hypothetical protein [Muribaculaceae bacterium]
EELQNDFAFKFFNADAEEGNSIVSPISLTTCLSMVANGASDVVKEEIVSTLLPAGGSLTDLNALNKYLAEELSEVDNSSILLLSNSIWCHKTYTLSKAFSNTLTNSYKASSASLDMHNKAAADRINDWVKKTTNGLIPKIYDTAPESDLLIINTMYFKGEWCTPFVTKLTKNDTFTNGDGSTVSIPFMTSEYLMRDVAATKEYTVVRIPYGNKAFSCYLLLTAEGTSSELDAAGWKALKERMSEKDLIVILPKFEIEHNVKKMEEKMRKAGVSKLFTDADALMNTTLPSINGTIAMRHKTAFKVSEQGAEGAGLTEDFLVSFDGETVPISKEVKFDRPFKFIIEEQSTGAIILMGSVTKL